MKKILISLWIICVITLGFLFTGCDETTNISDSYNTTNNTNSFNNYTEDQKDLISAGYIPNEEGVCQPDYFWCSTENKCLPVTTGAICPIGHEDE